MIDLHTHSLFSDGELVPSELVRRAIMKGYKAIAITDHVDASNIDFVVQKIAGFVQSVKDMFLIDVIAGAEITHAPPLMIPTLAKRARELGAMIVLVHGETLVEPVIEGTNRVALESDIDILAHPGLISGEEVELAKQNKIALEITARKGHSLSNGHVARLALDIGADLVINTDSHSPSDLITRDFAMKVLLGAGIPKKKINSIFDKSKEIVKKAMGG
ncbi:MAG: histidinol phosphate phosphatase domain-containing protein [Thermodesulfovibrionales bacterium]|nr:histidinol phosphate phosphatase domain-containing protein [Thermodesulfovibrionales bacterium]